METPSEMSVLMELIRIYMKDHYTHLEPEQLKQEAERLKTQLNREAAGRVFNWEPREVREAALTEIDRYYKEMKEWYTLFRPRLSSDTPK